MSFFNLLTKSQVTFKMDREFPGHIDYSVNTKDGKLLIIGDNRVYELQFLTNALCDKAAMKEMPR